MFGREAAKQLDYVECFPDGFRRGTKMIKACIDAKLEGFPTWLYSLAPGETIVSLFRFYYFLTVFYKNLNPNP